MLSGVAEIPISVHSVCFVLHSTLCLLSAEIPNYGAALIFELHSTVDINNTMWAVSLRQQDGSEAEYVTVELPCASPAASQIANSQSACMLQDFQELVAPEQFEWQVCGVLCASCGLIAPGAITHVK